MLKPIKNTHVLPDLGGAKVSVERRCKDTSRRVRWPFWAGKGAGFVLDTFENPAEGIGKISFKGGVGAQVPCHEVFLADFGSASKGADASLYEVPGKCCF